MELPKLYNFRILWGKDNDNKDDISDYLNCQGLTYHDGEVTFFDHEGHYHTIQKSNFRDIIILKPEKESVNNWMNQFQQGRI